MLEYTKRITFELSNDCNLAPIHEKCPAHHVKRIEALDTGIIHKTIDWAASQGFTGGFAFHMYNEPLMDKRVYDLCEYIQKKCPTSMGTLIWTNGAYLRQPTLDKLLARKVHTIRVSTYTKRDQERMEALALANPHAPLLFSFGIQVFDERLTKDAGHPQPQDTRPCYAPLVDLTVNHQGKLVLCCMDWNASVTYGNLYEQGVEELLRDNFTRMKLVYDQLSTGNRIFDMCRQCRMPRMANPNAAPGIRNPRPRQVA